MRKNTIRYITLLGAISMAGIILIQIYWVRKAFDLKEKQFNQTIQIALRNVAEKMAQYGQFSLPSTDLINQVSTDYYAVNLNNTIDAKTLEYYLINEFQKMGINTDFEYGIYDCSSDKMVYGNYVSSQGVVENKPVKALPKMDKLTYYFVIYFPERSSYITSKMDNWVLTSFILLFVIVFFSYALFIILRQRRLSEVQRDFINNMTHEFKTPISTIAIASETISQPDIISTPERLFTYSGIIHEEAARLNMQVERVLQTVKAERKEIQLNKEVINLHELIKTIVESFSVNARNKKGEIKLNLSATNYTIVADKHHLTNVIFNLLDNAVKYSVQAPVITVSTMNEGNKLLLSVSDEGMGIKKEYLKRIFDKFFRVPTGNIHNVKGFGLGLSYVKSIAGLHKWKIKVISEPEKGSTFTLVMSV
ncbi:MAG TPA: HAMP domain-containing sensor histidine kinase [Bacteroidia bacterium]|nr:HAMP domain-containing sensor histidine kinase [Bacteroidia bacterium]